MQTTQRTFETENVASASEADSLTDRAGPAGIK